MIRYVIFLDLPHKMTRASEPSCSLASFVLDVLARYQTRAKVLRRSGLKKNLQVLQNNLKFCLTRASSEEHNIYYCICYLLYGMMICIMSYRYTFFVAAKVLYRGYMVYIVAISVGARSFLLQYCNILNSIIVIPPSSYIYTQLSSCSNFLEIFIVYLSSLANFCLFKISVLFYSIGFLHTRNA